MCGQMDLRHRTGGVCRSRRSKLAEDGIKSAARSTYLIPCSDGRCRHGMNVKFTMTWRPLRDFGMSPLFPRATCVRRSTDFCGFSRTVDWPPHLIDGTRDFWEDLPPRLS